MLSHLIFTIISKLDYYYHYFKLENTEAQNFDLGLCWLFSLPTVKLLLKKKFTHTSESLHPALGLQSHSKRQSFLMFLVCISSNSLWCSCKKYIYIYTHTHICTHTHIYKICYIYSVSVCIFLLNKLRILWLIII